MSFPRMDSRLSLHSPCLSICHSSERALHHLVVSSICISSFESERHRAKNFRLPFENPKALRLADSSVFRDRSVLHPANFNCPIISLFHPHSVIIDPKMSTKACEHRWATLRSRTCLIYWACQMCYSGPHMLIYQCLFCRRRVCRRCSIKHWSFDRIFDAGKHLSR